MAQPTNTHSSYDAVGNREDLLDTIYNIAPTDTPFMTNIERAKATNRIHQWQTDTLASASGANAAIEGDDASGTARAATTLLSNNTQISTKTIIVTGTQRAIETAGRRDELEYQVGKGIKELKRDMETRLTQNSPKVTGNDTTARETGGLECWIGTNTSRGATGTDPSPIDGSDAPGDGTQRAFSETILKAVIKATYSSGGDPNIIMVGPANKQALSAFTGVTALRTEAPMNGKRAIIGGMDIYVSDFGELRVVPNRFQRDRSAFVLQTDMWATAYLRPFKQEPLGKTGDTEKRLLLSEYALESRNEKASGIAADLNT